MKDILLICPMLLIFVTGYFAMAKIDELLGFFKKGHTEEKTFPEGQPLYPGFLEETENHPAGGGSISA